MHGRFFAHVSALPGTYLDSLLACNPVRHDAVVARARATTDAASGSRIVALASLVATRLGTGEADELAVLVEDDWQRRGLGSAMVDALVAGARRRGVRRVQATVLPNAIGLLGWLGRTLPLERSVMTPYGATGHFRLD